MRWSPYAGWRALITVLAAALLLSLLGAERAEAVPSVTFKCSPAPQDCSGWYRSNASIDWTVIPSDAAVTGCQDKSFTTDTPGTNEFCSADDGSATVTVQLRVKVDKTPPTLLGGNPGRGADSNGWYNHPVSVAFSGTDQTSGIDAAHNAHLLRARPADPASLTGSCIDKADNVATLGYGLKYDSTAPVATGGQPRRQAGQERLAQPCGRGRLRRDRWPLGRARVHLHQLLRAGRAPRPGAGHLHRQGRQRQQLNPPAAAQLRRHAPVATGGAAARGPVT